MTLTDTALQSTLCSFDLHVPELLGPVMLGGTSILLHPDGHMDLDYMTHVIQRHQVTYMFGVPSHLSVLCEYLEQHEAVPFDRLVTLRSLCSGGEPMNIRCLTKFRQKTGAIIFNVFGPAECTDVSLCKIEPHSTTPIDATCVGRLSPNLRCCVLDPFMQSILPDKHQIGELYVSGHSVFAGYLNRDDLTQQVLICNLAKTHYRYYKTGDLVKLDPCGNLHYVGRRDFMVKLRGQRVELAEIEHIIADASPHVVKCVVVKHQSSQTDQQLLIAFVQTTVTNIESELQQRCQERLPPYMVPSVIVLLDRLPLSENGKVDRARLPLSEISISQYLQQTDHKPKSEMEQYVTNIWCEILRLESIPSKTISFFKLGGNSLLLMKLYYLYQKMIQFDSNSISISHLFRQPTVESHASLLEVQKVSTAPIWHSFNITEGPASFAQIRLYLDEHVRFDSSSNRVATYHMPFIYEINVGISICLIKLQRALQAVLEKHQVLRTRLIFDKDDAILRQQIVDWLPVEIISSTVECEKDLQDILYNEETNVTLFNLGEGRVFRCHAIRRSKNNDKDILIQSDILVFNFHHVAFDGSSIDIFFRDLQRAYSSDEPLAPCVLHYIDYSSHEKEVNMDEARVFWKNQLNGFPNTILQLPYDRAPHDNNTRSGHGLATGFELSKDVADRFISYMNMRDMTLFQVGLATLFTFLFKLTQKIDLCVLSVTANRPRAELQDIIGFFVNTLPYRIKVDPHLTFFQLVECVKELTLAILPHAHLPYQDIISNASTTAFQILLLVETVHEQFVTLDPYTHIHQLTPTNTDTQTIAKFDLTCSLCHNVQTRSISVSFNASSDLFDMNTVSTMARRFELLLDQVFSSSSSICELSLILPHEVELLHQLNKNEELLLPTHLMPIHHQFACRAEEHQQKVAVILDDQCLTYAELLYTSQLLASHLVDEYNVQPGDIIGQCVERSIEMVIGILSILMSGASYCPFAPNQPLARLHSLIQQVQTARILTHTQTNSLFLLNSVNVITVLSLPNSARWSNRCISMDVSSIAYMIFTSGSTGTPKVISISHKNFVTCMGALQQASIMTQNDTVLQTAPPTFDIHIEETLGTLWLGGTVCLLRPNGNLDMNYFTSVVHQHQITLVIMVPTHISLLAQYMQNSSYHQDVLKTIRRLCSIGEALLPQTASHIRAHLSPSAQIYNTYGPTECIFLSTFHIITSDDLNNDAIPIGRPVPGYTCYILDEYLQPVSCDHHIGQLFIGGEAVFSGYFQRPDLTHGTLVRLPQKEGIFYRTGDLVRIDAKMGVLYYAGREDFQVKLRGQRIELGEIEAVIMRASIQITNCVVIKIEHVQQEHLIAYIQSKTQLDTYMLRDECSKYLPLYMIPSLFVCLEHFPLNSNGKLDRKALPKPDFSLFLSSESMKTGEQPRTEIEQQIFLIWCHVLHLESIPSITTSFFTLGGNSLLLMKLQHAYETQFQRSLDIGDLFRRVTIADHAKLLQGQHIMTNSTWHSLNITEGT